MDTNDRERTAHADGGSGRTIRGPQSALTDYLHEIGVSDHFRERRRQEAEERRRQAEAAAALREQQAAAAAAETASTLLLNQTELAAVPEEEADEEPVVAESSSMAQRRVQPKRVTKKKKKHADHDSDEDEADYKAGLSKSSARKGGHFKRCEICDKQFLMRADYALPRLLCPACRKSVDKANKPEPAKQPAVKRCAAGLAAPAVSKRRRVRKTADGLLELDVKLPSLQDLCVRAIAKNIDQVESFGDVSEAVTLKLCRIISKMRLLDEQTLGLFLGAGRTTVTLYDCAKLTDHDLGRLLEYPNIESLHLGLCGRLTGGRLLDLANKLPNLTSLTLEGAFLVDDQAFADFFRIIGDRLRVFHVRWAGFGLTAMRALVVNCENLEDLSIAECTDFDDACLAMLAPPVDQAESDKQNAARKLRTRLTGKGKDAGEVPVPSWRALKLQRLGLGKPHHVMDHKTAMRVIEAVGHDLVSLDVSGFKDIKDEFVTVGLHKHCPMLRELTMDECLEITGTGLSQYFAGLREATGRRAGESLERVSLERCYGLTAETVQELVRSAGSSLQALNLNSVDDKMTKWGLMALTGRMYDAEGNLVEETTGCSCLAEIDLSWVRCTTDAVMEEVVRCCPRIATVRVYGCPGVTQFAPSRAGLRYLGRESDTL